VQAKVCRHEVNFVNAHAMSTQVGDLHEVEALKCFFGENPKVRLSKPRTTIAYGLAFF
jgi:3-oxoacyl-(acyl-carrier-protein) synthase